MDRWNEICFILSEKISPNITEQYFEKYVIEALRILGWSEFLGDIHIRPSFNIGASNRISPDILAKSGDKNLFVIELKQPNILLTPRFTEQLTSYLRILKLELGVIIGEKIQLIYDGKLSDKPFVFEEIEFKRDNPKGLEFVRLFNKENFSLEQIESFVHQKLEAIKNDTIIKNLKSDLLSDSFAEEVKSKIRAELLEKYDEVIVSNVLDKISIKISDESSMSKIENINQWQENVRVKENKNRIYNPNESELEIVKVQKKVPSWFSKPDQICSQILLTFLRLKNSRESVPYEVLENECKRIKTFRGNFYQMSNFGEKNHAKVFEKVGQLVTIWVPVKTIVENEYKFYNQKSN